MIPPFESIHIMSHPKMYIWISALLGIAIIGILGVFLRTKVTGLQSRDSDLTREAKEYEILE